MSKADETNFSEKFLYLWKEPVDSLVFLSHGVSHEEKVASETTFYGKVWLVVSITFDHEYLGKKSIDIIIV